MIEVKNLTKIFKSKNKEKFKALDNISFTLPDNGFIFIVGKSGSGKTTLLSILGGLDNFTDGEIIVDGNNFKDLSSKEFANYRNTKVGFIFQDYHLIDDLTIKENIKLILDLQKDSDDEKIINALKSVNLDGYENRFPKELSGGQKQRVAIARAIVKNPSIIFADEPTGNLDSKTTEQILELLKEFSKNRLVVIVSHNLIDATKYADRIIELETGKIIEVLERNPSFNDDVEVVNNTLYLPINRKYNKNEKKLILDNISSIKDIEQKDNKFIKSKNDLNIKMKKEPINEVHLSFFNKLKLGITFLKKKFGTLILYSFIIACLISVLGLTQTIVNFDKNRVLSNELEKYDQASLSLTKQKYKNIDYGDDTINKYIKPIEEGDIEAFIDAGYNGNIYKLYATPFSITKSKVSFSNKFFDVPNNDLLLNEVRGTLVCDEQLLIDKYGINGKVDYIALSKNPKDYGVYISDYAADSMLAVINGASNSHFTYDKIIGEFICYSNYYRQGYINGIFNTNYKTRYKTLLDKYNNDLTQSEKVDLLKTSEAQNLIDEIIQSLSISYSFNENFYDSFINDYHSNYFVDKNGLIGFNGSNYVIENHVISSRALKQGELSMPVYLYNEITGKECSEINMSDFEPIDVSYTEYDYDFRVDPEHAKPLITKNMKVVELRFDRYFSFNSQDIKDLRRINMVPYELYFDDNSNSSTIIELGNELGYMLNSSVGNTVLTMTEIVTSFSDFFNIIFVVICCSILLLLIQYCVKVIRERKYEIGVLKSLGFRTSDFIVVFGIHVISLITLILVLYGTFSIFVVDLGNEVLVNSLKNLSNSLYATDIKLLYVNGLLVLYNIIGLIVVGLLSYLVSIIRLNNIKPMNIIKAKE